MNSHKMTMSWIAIVCFAGLLAACGGEDAKDAVEAAKDAAKEAAVAAEEAAGDAAAAAGEAAAEAVDAAGEAADAAAAAAGEAAEEVTGAAAVTLCKELAAKASWVDALGVCERAHEAAPDDMAVEHALQQAQAAAKAGS
ncbi:MAG: hypothetical protein OEP95_15305 [Myxococcales bacterium]|nr:hypothetical protein [Myxococcales bacterium]